MELITSNFGKLEYDPQEVIHWQRLSAAADEGQAWILLADQSHPNLYWLQNLSATEQSVPVYDVATQLANYRLTLTNLPATNGADAPSALLCLAPLVKSKATWQVDTQHPIVVDIHSRRAWEIQLDGEQVLQHESSEKVAPLRECA